MRFRWLALAMFSGALLLLFFAGDVGAWASVLLLFALVVLLAGRGLVLFGRRVPRVSLPLTPKQEVRVVVAVSGCLFALSAVGDWRKDLGAWAWNCVSSLGLGLLLVLILRRMSFIKRSRAVWVSCCLWVGVLAAGLGYAASHRWHDQPILDDLLLASCLGALTYMALAGRPLPHLRRGASGEGGL